MNPMDDQETRWLAHFLGESPPEERSQIESEMRADPRKAEEFRRLVEGVSRWAKEPVPDKPLDLAGLGLDRLGLDQAGPGALSRPAARIRSPAGLWAMALAAAALFVFALAQAQFTIRLGSAEFSWGKGAVAKRFDQLSSNVESLTSQVRECRQAAEANAQSIQETGLRAVLLEDELHASAAQLIRLQQAETRTRYSDVRNLLRLTGYEGPGALEWAFSEGRRAVSIDSPSEAKFAVQRGATQPFNK